MSKATDIGKALDKLLKSARQKRKNIEEAPPRDATTQLAVSFFQWQTTRDMAEQALGQILAVMVDINELRVSHYQEVVEVIGEDYPLLDERLFRMRDSLNEVFRREHGMEIASLEGKSKKDQRQYLETLPGAPPYVVSQVMLLSFGGHAVPVDEKLLALLVREGVLEEGLTCAEAEALLMKHVKAADAPDTHLVLQAWADGLKTPDTALEAAVAPRQRLVAEPTVASAEPEPATATKKKTAKSKAVTTKKKVAKTTKTAKASKTTKAAKTTKTTKKKTTKSKVSKKK